MLVSAGYLVLTGSICRVIYDRALGVAMELSLWLPLEYQMGLPDAGGLLQVSSFFLCLAAGSRLAVTLLSWPGPYHVEASMVRFQRWAGSYHEQKRSEAFVELIATAPFSVGTFRCFLLFIPLSLIHFPYLEHQRAASEQRSIVWGLDEWLDIDGDDADRLEAGGTSEAIEYLFMDLSPSSGAQEVERGAALASFRAYAFGDK